MAELVDLKLNVNYFIFFEARASSCWVGPFCIPLYDHWGVGRGLDATLLVTGNLQDWIDFFNFIFILFCFLSNLGRMMVKRRCSVGCAEEGGSALSCFVVISTTFVAKWEKEKSNPATAGETFLKYQCLWLY